MNKATNTTNDFASMRVEYARDALLEANVPPNPIDQFAKWFAEIRAIDAHESNAMTLATVDSTGAPSARVVLLKEFDQRGFVFYTNYCSRKGRELESNPRAALCFLWQALERQVRIEGMIEKVSRAESESYFMTRPRGAQIGAWVSQQSESIESREALDARAADLEKKYEGQPVPLPESWGGYRVLPHTIEFWQGRPSRLHDRLLYVRQGDGSWKIGRLSP